MEETITLSRRQPWDQLRSLRRATTRSEPTLEMYTLGSRCQSREQGRTSLQPSVGVSTADTEILGADGTTVNTGHLNGSMRNMELRLGRPLQRAVCTLHQAELPLRKMFEHLDGPTTGPRSYSGPIGKLLKSDQLHLTPLNHHFTPLHLADIPPLSPDVKEKMSTDAVLLHDRSQYVNTGIPGSDNLAQRKIGPLNHSRWLTHATRIERLLLSTNPDKPFYSNLVLLATYIIAIYFTGHMEV